MAQKPLLRSRPGRLQFDQTERQQHDRRTIRSRALRRNMFEFAEVLARAVQIQRSNANLYVADSSHTYLIRSLPVLRAVSLFLLFSREQRQPAAGAVAPRPCFFLHGKVLVLILVLVFLRNWNALENVFPSFPVPLAAGLLPRARQLRGG